MTYISTVRSCPQFFINTEIRVIIELYAINIIIGFPVSLTYCPMFLMRWGKSDFHCCKWPGLYDFFFFLFRNSGNKTGAYPTSLRRTVEINKIIEVSSPFVFSFSFHYFERAVLSFVSTPFTFHHSHWEWCQKQPDSKVCPHEPFILVPARLLMSVPFYGMPYSHLWKSKLKSG